MGRPNSHSTLGWDKLTDKIINKLSKRGDMIFVLWGKSAQKKYTLIDKKNNEILETSHPSPFSANRGFFGCKHFSKINNILKREGANEIDWQLK